jgi:hypothetical protein
MEQDLRHGLRARAAQLATWFLSQMPYQRQQQTMQADRQVFDGVTRSNDDPDNRRQQQPQAQPLSVYDASRERRDMRTTVQIFAAEAAPHRLAMPTRAVEWGHRPEMDSGYRPRPATLVERLVTLRERVQGQGTPSLLALRPDQTLMLRDHLRLFDSQQAQTSRPQSENLTARVEALQHRLQTQQQAQRGRGQGRGW